MRTWRDSHLSCLTSVQTPYGWTEDQLLIHTLSQLDILHTPCTTQTASNQFLWKKKNISVLTAKSWATFYISSVFCFQRKTRIRNQQILGRDSQFCSTKQQWGNQLRCQLDSSKKTYQFELLQFFQFLSAMWEKDSGHLLFGDTKGHTNWQVNHIKGLA